MAQQQAGLARLQARVQASPVNDDKDKPAETSPTTTSRTPKATKPGLSPHLRILSPRPLNSLGSELEDIAESLNAKAGLASRAIASHCNRQRGALCHAVPE